MAFRVGQKVIFIGRVRPRGTEWGPKILLQIGEIYTIRDIDARYVPYFGCTGIRVEEAVVPLVSWEGVLIESALLATEFRPIVSTDTGMAVLEQIRRDVTNKELRRYLRMSRYDGHSSKPLSLLPADAAEGYSPQ